MLKSSTRIRPKGGAIRTTFSPVASIGALTPGRATRQVTCVTQILVSSTDVTGNARPQTKETVLSLIRRRTFRIFSSHPRRATLVADTFRQGVGGAGRHWALTAAGSAGRASRSPELTVTAGTAIAPGAVLARAGLDVGLGPLGRRAFIFGLVTGRLLPRLRGLWRIRRYNLSFGKRHVAL